MEMILQLALYFSPIVAITLAVIVSQKSKRIRRLESKIDKLHVAEKDRLASQTERMAEVVKLLRIQSKYLKSMSEREKTFS